MRKINLTYLFIVLFLMISCGKEDDFGEQVNSDTGYTYGKGFFLVNEGNFNQGNGSLHFYNETSKTLYKDIFREINGRPVGDVPQSMTVIGDKGYIVVNNSGRIEIAGLNSFSSIQTVEGFLSPRFILQVSSGKAYVSDLKATGISVMDLDNNSIAGMVECGKSTDRMLLFHDKVFACNWSSYYNGEENNTVSVIDAVNNEFLSYIKVTKEPNSIVLDKNDNIWVLCSGGFMNEEIPALYCIDGDGLSVLKKLEFPFINSNPTHLVLNRTKDSLIFINEDVYIMDINDDTIPEEPFILSDGHLFTGCTVDPGSGNIYLSDAIDYQQNGLIQIYDPAGNYMTEIEAGIIPGYICFVSP